MKTNINITCKQLKNMCAFGFYSLKVKKNILLSKLYIEKIIHFQNIIIGCMKCRMNGNKNFFCKYLS